MKKIFCLLLFFGFFMFLSCNEVSFVASSIKQIVQNLTETIDIVIYAEKVGKLKEIANEVMKTTNSTHTITITKNPSIGLNRSSILLFDTTDMFHTFTDNAQLKNQYPRDFFFLSYVNKNTMDLKSELTYLSPSPLFQQGHLLAHENNRRSLRLTTFVKYQQPNCNEWKEMEVYRFSNSPRKSKRIRDPFAEKFSNFNGCHMKISAPWPHVNFLDCFFENGVLFNCKGSAVTTYFTFAGHSARVRALTASRNFWYFGRSAASLCQFGCPYSALSLSTT
jgi:hypothetical protein